MMSATTSLGTMEAGGDDDDDDGDDDDDVDDDGDDRCWVDGRDVIEGGNSRRGSRRTVGFF